MSNGNPSKLDVYRANVEVRSLDASQLDPRDKADFVKGLVYFAHYELVSESAR
ncbi:MAG: hypothetical protein ACJAS1_005160 [Oleiphilaceae bacterium]|jgi:hypothetical protein